MQDSAQAPEYSMKELPNTLPDFSVPADAIITETKRHMSVITKLVERITENNVSPTWENVQKPLEEAFNRLHIFNIAQGHLHTVLNAEELHSIETERQKLLSDFNSKILQNKKLFELYEEIQKTDTTLDLEQKKVLENSLFAFRLAGVALGSASKNRLKAYNAELVGLSIQFAQNTLNATDGWYKHVEDERELDGLGESMKMRAQSEAERKGLHGFVFTLRVSSYAPLLQYAKNRSLRRKMYEAYNTRASDKGPQANQFNNIQIVDRMLDLQFKKAQLLGFHHFAEYSLARKMVGGSERVMTFLLDFVEQSKWKGREEFEKIQAYARRDGIYQLKPWDVLYYFERVKEAEFGFSNEEVRDYFPVPKVLSGMFGIVNRLYGITLRTPAKNPPLYHPSVIYYNVLDENQNLIGGIYMDLYARQKKVGGAWMDEPVRRMIGEDGLQLPIAFLSCNFPEPIGEKPSCLNHGEVKTLFHEFGHCLHHLLTRVDYFDISGIEGVEWDAVELPSQFFEYWCFDEMILTQFLSEHKDTGEPIPKELVHKMLRAGNYDSGFKTLRQLELALFDFKLYLEYKGKKRGYVMQKLREVRKLTALLPSPLWDRFPYSFTHIFGGGYSAGYYGYKWAEVLAADAFEPFDGEKILDRRQGEKFLSEILSRGGSRTAMENFIAYRGREPSISALLRYEGLERH